MSSPYDSLVPSNGDSDNPNPKPTEPQSQENNMNGKPILKSKTFWVNALTAIAGVVSTVVGSDLIQNNPEWAGYGAAALGVVNVVLRLFTKEPVTSVTKTK